MKLSSAVSLIDEDLRKRILSETTADSIFKRVKRAILKYSLRKPDWINSVDRKFCWINAQYAMGILSSGTKEDIRVLTHYYDSLLILKYLGYPVFEVPDQVPHAEVMLKLYFDYGKKRYIPLINEAATMLAHIAEINEGFVIYWPPDPALLLDSLGMISNFCYLYDEVFHTDILSKVAQKLLDTMEHNCVDPDTGFLYHSYNYVDGKTEGVSTWGRGIGWYLLGLTSYVQKFGLKADRLVDILGRIYAGQDEAGFLYDDVKLKRHVDSSPTCMAAYCMALCIDNNIIEEEELSRFYASFSKSVLALLSCVNKNGEVLNCSGECAKAGEYSRDFGNYFSQGYTLMLFQLILRSKKLQLVLEQTQKGRLVL